MTTSTFTRTPAWILEQIIKASTPVIKIYSLRPESDGTWARGTNPKDSRYGPWRKADYEILNQVTLGAKQGCLFFVVGDDGKLRYFGTTKSHMKERVRVCKARNPENTSEVLAEKELYVSCFRDMEKELEKSPKNTFEVRCVDKDVMRVCLEEPGNESVRELFSLKEVESNFKSVKDAIKSWLNHHKLASWGKGS